MSIPICGPDLLNHVLAGNVLLLKCMCVFTNKYFFLSNLCWLFERVKQNKLGLNLPCLALVRARVLNGLGTFLLRNVQIYHMSYGLKRYVFSQLK